MERLKYWSGLFWSPEFYANALRQGGSLGFRVLGLVVLVITASQLTFYVPRALSLRDELHVLADKMPDFRMDQGTATVTAPQFPHVVEHILADGEKIRMVFDTSKDAFTNEELQSYTADGAQIFGMSAKHLYSVTKQKNQTEAQINERSIDPRISEMQVGQEKYHQLINRLPAFLLLLVAALFAAKWVGAILFALLLGLVGNAAKPRAAESSKYPDLVRVASYSLVPFLLITTVLHVPFGPVGLFGLAVLHYLLVLQLAKRALPPETAAN